MAGRADGFLKIAAGISFLFAAYAVGNHFLVYLPSRDAQIDSQREQARQAQEFREQQGRDAVRQQAEADRISADYRAAAVQTRYEECLTVATRNYSSNWDSACRALADRNKTERANCTMGKTCDSLYPVIPVK